MDYVHDIYQPNLLLSIRPTVYNDQVYSPPLIISHGRQAPVKCQERSAIHIIPQ